MAVTELEAECDRANPLAVLTRMAQEIQTAVGRTRHLLTAMDEANEKLGSADLDETLLPLWDRVAVFYELADAAANEAQNKAEEMESVVLRMNLKDAA